MTSCYRYFWFDNEFHETIYTSVRIYKGVHLATNQAEDGAVHRLRLSRVLFCGVVLSAFIRFQLHRQDIIVQAPCPPPNGTQVLSNFGYLTSQNVLQDYDGSAPVAMAVFLAVFFLIVCLAFVANFRRKKLKRGNKIDANKPWCSFASSGVIYVVSTIYLMRNWILIIIICAVL